MDADTVCFRSLEPLRKHGFFAGYHNFKNPGIPHSHNKNIASAVIGSIKNHPLAQELVTTLNNDVKHARGAAWKNVGPGLLTRIVKDCKSCNATGDIYIYPYWAFVRGVRARSARISLFLFTYSEDSLVSRTQPISLISLFLFTYSEDSLVSRTQPMSLTRVTPLCPSLATIPLDCVPHSQQYHSNVAEILNSRFALEHRYLTIIVRDPSYKNT